MTEQNLSPKLLHNLETHYTQVSLMWQEKLNIEQMLERLKISEDELTAMLVVMFNERAIYTTDNIFGNSDSWQFNAATLHSRLITEDRTKGDRV
jgi:hypothetical protein